MRIAFFEIHEPWEEDFLSRALQHNELDFAEEPLTSRTAEPAKDSESISVSIRSRVDESVLEQLKKLVLITTRSTGFDHIDTAACERRGITVSNVPHYGENPVAEHTFGLTLNLSRKLCLACQRTRHGDFSLKGLEGFDLRGKTLGVVGAGAIGLHVIRIAVAFGMEVLAFDARPQQLIAEVIGFRYTSLEELLSRADVVTLHVPLLPDTRHLMNRTRFTQMKRGAVLVNTGRGPLIDTEALLWALDEGIVAAAGLDVLEGEEVLAEESNMFRTNESRENLERVLASYQLLKRENVIITPHMAWYSREARERILSTTAETIAAFASGKFINVVAGPTEQTTGAKAAD